MYLYTLGQIQYGRVVTPKLPMRNWYQVVLSVNLKLPNKEDYHVVIGNTIADFTII